MKLLRFDQIDSTNAYLKREYKSLDNLTLVTANHQTAGKGRLGRKWEDDSSSLLFSILLKDNLEDKNISLLSLLSGECLFQTLKDYGIDSKIKWPNDVLINDKKCAGILLESIFEERLEALIIGIGININNKSFNDEIKNKAISLYLATGKVIDKDEFLNKFIFNFEKRLNEFLKGNNSFMDVICSNSYLDQKEVNLNYYGEDKNCKVICINKDGTLQVESKGQTYSLNSGEVTLEKNY